MCRYYLRVQTCYPIAKHSNKGYSELMAYATLYLTISHHFPLYPTISHNFAPYPTLSHHLPIYPTLSHSIPPFLTISHSIPLYPTIFHSIQPFPTNSHSIPLYSTFSHYFQPCWNTSTWLRQERSTPTSTARPDPPTKDTRLGTEPPSATEAPQGTHHQKH